MVGHAALREVIGAIAVAAVAAAQQVAARGGFRLLTFGHFGGADARAQHRQRLGFVFMLRTLVLALHHDAGGQVGNADSRVGGVNVLTACPGGTEGIDAQIRRVNVRHFGFRQLRHHRHRTGGGVDPPLRFGGRHTLHAMAAGFKFQPTVNAVAADLGDHLFKAAVLTFVGAEDLYLPAARFCVTGVHAE